jgi:hypothetical protein
MRRIRTAFALALPCALLLASAPLAAQQVYKWKDANGVTQYTSTPPPEGSTYETREVDNRHPAPQAADEAPAEDPGCAIARGNLALLNGLDKLGPDEDGDGRPDRTYTDAERADQVALAEAAIKVRCTTPPAAPAEREEEPEETGDN